MNNTLEFNPAFAGLKPSSTLYINEAVNRLWQNGEPAFHMGFGESRFDVHPRLQTSLAEHANKKSYLPARGLPALIESVASYYSDKLTVPFDPSQVIIGPGSKSLIYGLQMVLNADVFLPTPSWVSYAPQATLLGKRYHYIPSTVESDYKLDISALDELVRASDNPCKMLIINSPNNPSGEVVTPDFLKALAEYCRNHKIWVLSDEIYFEVCHGDTPHTSISSFYPEGTFVLGGLSKHFSIGGWRVGVGLMPDTAEGQEILKKLVVFASETWSGVSAPIQYAAIDAYQQHADVEQYVTDCRAIHGIRTRFIRDSLRGMDIRCTAGQGAFYLMPNFNHWEDALRGKGVLTSAQLAHYLLQNYNMATLPGSDFGVPENVLSLRLSTSYLDMEADNAPSEIFHLYQDGIGDKSLMSDKHHPNTHAALAAYRNLVDDLSDSTIK